MRSGLLSLVYVVVGIVIASSHHYFTHATTLKPIASAVLAVALWPLLLLGINLHRHQPEEPNGQRPAGRSQRKDLQGRDRQTINPDACRTVLHRGDREARSAGGRRAVRAGAQRPLERVAGVRRWPGTGGAARHEQCRRCPRNGCIPRLHPPGQPSDHVACDPPQPGDHGHHHAIGLLGRTSATRIA